MPSEISLCNINDHIWQKHVDDEDILIDLKNLPHPPARAAREVAIEICALCKSLSLVGRLISELGAGRRVLMRRLMTDSQDKPVFLLTQAHLVPSGDQS